MSRIHPLVALLLTLVLPADALAQCTAGPDEPL